MTQAGFADLLDREEAALTSAEAEASSYLYGGGDGNDASASSSDGSRRRVVRRNQRMHALYRASTYALAVSSGAEAVKLLCRSKRIFNDLHEVLEVRCGVFP